MENTVAAAGGGRTRGGGGAASGGRNPPRPANKAKPEPESAEKKGQSSDFITPQKMPAGGAGVGDRHVSPSDQSVASSSSSGGSAEAMRIRQLEQQLEATHMSAQEAHSQQQQQLAEQQRQIQEQARQLAFFSAQQQHIAQQQQQQQQQFVSQQQRLPPADLPVRMAAVQPTKLTFARATAGTALDDWLFEVDQLCTQLHKPQSDGAGRIAAAGLHWDRGMQLWFDTQQQQTPVHTWPEFVAALRKQFTPVGDEFAARDELFSLKMRGGESMDAYMQRAVLLVTRVGGLVDSRMAAVQALRGVDESRFPFTVAEARRKERESGVQGMTFAQMRSDLTLGAHNEPKLRGTSHSSSNSSSNSSSSGSRAGGSSNSSNSSKQHRIAALKQSLDALMEESDDGEDGGANFSAAPLSTSGAGAGAVEGKCYKCGKQGHVVAECNSSKELRKCYNCHETGHLANKCPAKRKAKAKSGNSSSGGGGGSGSKGAEDGSSSSKSVPKNE